jgi:hypothetical protein
MPKTKPNESWREALATYQGEIDDLKVLVERLEHYRNGCSDTEWIIIHNAIQCMKVKIKKMILQHELMSKKNES